MNLLEVAARAIERTGRTVPRGPGSLYRQLESLRFLATRDRAEALRFLGEARSHAQLAARVKLLIAFIRTTNHVRAYHTQAEMLTVSSAILARGRKAPLTVVECGAAKGASTAKLSLALQMAGGGRLHCFDSFKGIPENDEVHQNLDGRSVRFRKGAFLGRLGAVKRAVEGFGAPELVSFHKGWFEDSLPSLAVDADVVLLDVDLWSSTRTCLIHLFPRLRAGAVVFSQDGHLERMVRELGREAFWRDEVGVPPPRVHGLGTEKLLRIEPA